MCGRECVRVCLYCVSALWHLKDVVSFLRGHSFLFQPSTFKSNNLVALETWSNCVLKATSFFIIHHFFYFLFLFFYFFIFLWPWRYTIHDSEKNCLCAFLLFAFQLSESICLKICNSLFTSFLSPKVKLMPTICWQ